MATTNITIRMDADLKRQVEELYSDLGMNLTTAFTVFAKQSVREQKLPFVVSRAYSPETIQALEDTRNGIGLSRGFTSISELTEELNTDD